MATRNNIWANIDWLTVALYILMIFLGWFNIYAAVYNDEFQSILDFNMRYGKQAIWISAALIIALIVLIVDSKFYISFAFPIYFFIILLLIAVLFLGTEVKGARSWFQIGSFAIQPSEFAKLGTAMALAKYLSSYSFKMDNFRSLMGIGAIILGPILLILLQNDTGSALVFVVFILVLYREGLSGAYLFFGFIAAILFIITLVLSPTKTTLILLAVAVISSFFILQDFKQNIRGLIIGALLYIIAWGANILFKLDYSQLKVLLYSVIVAIIIYGIYAIRKKSKKLLIIIGLLAGALVFTMSVDYVFNNILEKHQQARINELLGIESNPLGVGYHVNQSKIAIGSGGITGKGFLNGTQTKFDFVPEQSTDFIFCTIGEEWGFIGTTLTIILFLTFFIRLIYLAERQRTKFSRIYGYSVVCILFYHFAINIGMTVGLAPVIGIPLPFFSYGGSSLWSFTVLLFIFIRLDASRLEQLGY